jgi:radical SAM protein with 4Fe4S-binding SPASM domain
MPLVNRAGTLEIYESLRAAEPGNTNFVWKGLKSGVNKLIGCYHPFYKMNVLFNGDVILCCHDWNRATAVGNVIEPSLKEVWNSPKMNEVRRLILRKRYAGVDSCKYCSMAK